MKRFIVLILILALCAGSFGITAAASETADNAADNLFTLGLFLGVNADAGDAPNFELDRAPSRYEAVTMLVRLLGKEAEARAGEWTTPFTDVVDWAEPFVGYAYENGLTSGTSATTFEGDLIIPATQYLTFVLRALGYNDRAGDFAWDKAWELSDELGITGGEYNAETNAEFLRGDVVLISFDALDANMKGSDMTLAEKLIEAGVFTAEAAEAVGLNVIVESEEEPEEDEPEEEPKEEEEEEDEEPKKLISYFDLDQVEEILGSEFWRQYWIMPEEHSFMLNNGVLIRWQLLHVDGFNFYDGFLYDGDFDIDYANILGTSFPNMVLLLLTGDGAGYIYIDIGSALEVYFDLLGGAEEDMPGWIAAEGMRGYYAIPLD